VAAPELLLPRLGGEGVVDGDDVDARHALGGEGVGVLEVAGDLRGAGRGEGAGDADDDDWGEGTLSSVFRYRLGVFSLFFFSFLCCGQGASELEMISSR
jgi:hypothetical protein